MRGATAGIRSRRGNTSSGRGGLDQPADYWHPLRAPERADFPMRTQGCRGFPRQIGADRSPAAPHPPAPLGARVRAPVGWRILDAPGVPPSPRERGEGWGEGHRRCDASVAATYPRTYAPHHNPIAKPDSREVEPGQDEIVEASSFRLVAGRVPRTALRTNRVSEWADANGADCSTGETSGPPRFGPPPGADGRRSMPRRRPRF